MALTTNGKLIGRAAAEARRDLRNELLEDEQRRADELFDQFIAVRDTLKELDPAGWSQWYDEFVPDWKGWINSQPAIDVIAKRIEELKTARQAK